MSGYKSAKIWEFFYEVMPWSTPRLKQRIISSERPTVQILEYQINEKQELSGAVFLNHKQEPQGEPLSAELAYKARYSGKSKAVDYLRTGPDEFVLAAYPEWGTWSFMDLILYGENELRVHIITRPIIWPDVLIQSDEDPWLAGHHIVVQTDWGKAQ